MMPQNIFSKHAMAVNVVILESHVSTGEIAVPVTLIDSVEPYGPNNINKTNKKNEKKLINKN